MMDSEQITTRRRRLAVALEARLEQGIRDGRWPKGSKLPSEAALLNEYGVSRTVVREALSRLQAMGKVTTRHGIGTFVADTEVPEVFRIYPDQIPTLEEVLQILELRIAVESEAAALASLRRTDAQLLAMSAALDDFSAAVDAHRNSVEFDYQFHLQVAKATENTRFVELMETMGRSMIPRDRLNRDAEVTSVEMAYLRRVNDEHHYILSAIEERDFDRARAAMRSHLTNSRERRRLSSLRL